MKTDNKRTEAEVREAIANDYTHWLATQLTTQEIQDLAVIIGKALGVVE